MTCYHTLSLFVLRKEKLTEKQNVWENNVKYIQTHSQVEHANFFTSLIKNIQNVHMNV